LKPAAAYELGAPWNSIFSMSMYPVYVRGMAYLDARQGALAAAEFQKMVDQPGVAISESIGALAHVGLARAYAMVGDLARAKKEYEVFLKLWKDGDGDVPVLQDAKAEYGKLG
jgi:hypothetical protein